MWVMYQTELSLDVEFLLHFAIKSVDITGLAVEIFQGGTGVKLPQIFQSKWAESFSLHFGHYFAKFSMAINILLADERVFPGKWRSLIPRPGRKPCTL